MQIRKISNTINQTPCIDILPDTCYLPIFLRKLHPNHSCIIGAQKGFLLNLELFFEMGLILFGFEHENG